MEQLECLLTCFKGPLDIDEMMEIEQFCLNHPAVKAEIEKLNLPPGMSVCLDPWIYGTDNPEETRRLFQCYMYIVAVDHPQHNQYSLPCKFSPVIDGISRQLVRIDYLPDGADTQSTETRPWKPIQAIQYAHELLDEPLRTDLKPYIVQQPEGASFEVVGNAVAWQKWRFHVGFNNREGLVLHNLTYDGRSTFYRLSVSEMTVPYGGMWKGLLVLKLYRLLTCPLSIRPSCTISSQTGLRCRRCRFRSHSKPALLRLRLPWTYQIL